MLEDVGKVGLYFYPQTYTLPFEPAPGGTTEFIEVGHILGSSGIRLELQEIDRRTHSSSLLK